MFENPFRYIRCDTEEKITFREINMPSNTKSHGINGWTSIAQDSDEQAEEEIEANSRN
jgi:hypothetical protein